MISTTSSQGRYRFLILPTAFILLIWLIFFFDYIFSLHLAQYAVEPRTAGGLLGVLVFPLLHGSLSHIAGNSISLFALLLGLRYIFPTLFLRVFSWSYLLPGAITWLIGRPSFHLGASGMIYALVAFLFVSGVIRVNRYLLALSLLVVFLYGSLFWGIFPIEEGISWEGHLGGAITGFVLAIAFRNEDPADEVIEREPDWGDDEDEPEDHEFFPEDQEHSHDIDRRNTTQNELKIVYTFKPKSREDEDNLD